MATLDLGKVVGEPGAAGPGVASGGTTGQYLKKASGTDYDTAWESFANATQSAAGMMSATDKTKLDSLPSTAATQSATGLMSAADKAKLDGLPTSAAKPDAIAIIVDGDTAGAAVAAGAYAYIKNNTHGLAEGLYKNKSSSAFPVIGGTANSTVFEAVTGGGLNALNEHIANIVENGEWTTITVDSQHTYTVQENGTLYVSVSPLDENVGYAIYTINTWRFIRINCFYGFADYCYVPVCKNDVIAFSAASENIETPLIQYRKMH